MLVYELCNYGNMFMPDKTCRSIWSDILNLSRYFLKFEPIFSTVSGGIPNDVLG